jgi:hypothetical protein
VTSAMGHSRRGQAGSRSTDVRSAPKATNNRLRFACREGPNADSCSATNEARTGSNDLLNHLVGKGEQPWRHLDGE